MKAAFQLLQLPDEIQDVFYEHLQRLRDSESLCDAVNRFHQKLFHPEDDMARNEAANELLAFVAELASSEDDASAGEAGHTNQTNTFGHASQAGLANMFIPIVLVTGLPHVLSIYQERAIPLEILTHTLSDLELNIRRTKRQTGQWGSKNLKWLIRHFTANIYHIGRLQFHFNPFPYNVNVLRHVETNEIAAFSGDGVDYRSDGLVDGTNGIYQCAWTSQFVMTSEEIIGHRISNDGDVAREKTRLSSSQWKLVLKEGDTILKVHIPASGKMTHELCQASYIEAIRFFTKYFPETDFAAIFCATWLLSPQWRSLLPAESNIVKFQQDYHLFPIISEGSDTLLWVFGNRQPDLASAPRETLLHRVILDHVSAGGLFHNGAGFMMKEDLAAPFA